MCDPLCLSLTRLLTLGVVVVCIFAGPEAPERAPARADRDGQPRRRARGEAPLRRVHGPRAHRALRQEDAVVGILQFEGGDREER